MFFKIPRYGRLFEIDSQIEEIIEYYGQQKTVFEIKRIEHYLGMAKFALSTLINLHLLTCIMIVLCICKPDGYKSSWMYGNILGDEETKNNFIDKYVIAVYFVTTTLTTCGFGDLSATSGDWYESMSIMGLQFVGMLFYSLTIQKVQSYLLSNELSPQEYANHMVEVVEFLIIRVGKNLPAEEVQIPGDVINQWKIHTLRYFQMSPDAFLQLNEFYQLLSSNMKVKVVKQNLVQAFQQRFEILFVDSEFGFKADDRLIAELVSSISYVHLRPPQKVEDMVNQGYEPNIIGASEEELDNSLIQSGQVSKAVYFVFEGEVEMFYRNQT